MILHIILFILLFFLVIVVVGFSVLFKLMRMFGLGRKSRNGYYNSEKTFRKDGEDTSYGEQIKKKGTERKKIFDKTEGEYIDFEDV